MGTTGQFKAAAARLERSGCGPIGPHLGGFADWLSEQGYARGSGMRKIGLAVLLSRWLERKGIALEQLDERQVEKFTLSQREPLSRRTEVQHTIRQLLQHLRRSLIIPPPNLPTPSGMTEHLLDEYRRFLIEERGLRPLTLVNYLPVARRLLARSLRSGRMRLEKLSAADVKKFVSHEKDGMSAKRLQLVASALRSFLGFLHLHGHVPNPLAGAVPKVATSGMSGVPRFLEPEQVRRLLQSCMLTNACGRRDYAVLLLMARLGLRSGEIVSLCLEDISWVDGEIIIRGKSAREERLPLPSDVGHALATYLRKDRPRCECRRVFIRIKAPHMGFSSPVAVGDILRRALRRAGIKPIQKGAQLLRHSLATRMLRGGASLTQIGLILRHGLPQTTEIYAKVDIAALRAIAQPWPLSIK